MSLDTFSHVIVGLVILFVSIWAFIRWLKHRGSARGWFFLTIATLAEVVIVDTFLVGESLNSLGRIAMSLEFIILAFFPYSLYRFSACFAKASRKLEWFAALSLALVILVTAWVPAEYFTPGFPAPSWFPAYLVGFFAYWLGFSMLVAKRLWSGGRGQPTVISRRMRTLAVGAIGTVSALIVSTVLTPDETLAILVIEMVQVVSVLLLALGYDPPVRVRRSWRQNSEIQLRQAAIALVKAKSEQEAVQQLLPRALAILGAQGAAWYDNDGRRVVSEGEGIPDDIAELSTIQPNRYQKAGDIILGDQRAEMRLRRGRIVLWISAYTPFFGSEEIDVVRNIGVLLDLAGEREARLAERNRRFEAENISAVLSASVMPDKFPETPGLHIGAQYTPASTVAGIGGDWYDVFALSSHEVLLAIGDVMGKGVGAAAVMGQLRNGLRAYVLDGASPGEALEKLNRLCIRSHSETMATIWVGVWDLASNHIRTSSAGHLPPILVNPDHSTELIEFEGEVPIGVVDKPNYSEHDIELPPYGELIVYTDGIVERRGESLDEGLRRALTWWQEGTASEVAKNFIDQAIQDGAGSDDMAVLVAQAHPIGKLNMKVPADPRNLSSIRAGLRRWIRESQLYSTESQDMPVSRLLPAQDEDQPVGGESQEVETREGSGGQLSDSPPQLIQDPEKIAQALETLEWRVLMTSGEALANAVEHAYGTGGGMVEIQAERVHSCVWIQIRDWGNWRQPRDRDRGRGTGLMKSMSDHFETSQLDGTVVHLRFDLE
jgi:serine phosphatase RsbU (regulator of sigma subunit)